MSDGDATTTMGRDLLLQLVKRAERGPEPSVTRTADAPSPLGTRAVLEKIATAKKGTVYLVGAGPGDPAMLTLKAAAMIATADVVLHDDLVTEETRSMAGPQTMLINVGKRCGVKTITQEFIHSSMIRMARANLAVVRLQSGDPLVFGRSGEEMDALSEADVPFEVIPGITSASAAAAMAKVPLTDRRFAHTVAFYSGHRAEAGGEESAPAILGTRVFYMPGRSLRKIAMDCARQGYSADVPCVLVSCATMPNQTMVRTTLARLASLELTPAPSVLLIGWALETYARRQAISSLRASA
jgi:uroporphyrin-III C-methyltransferase